MNRPRKSRPRLAPKATKQPKKQTKEVSLLGQALRSLGSLGGTALGGLVGAPSTGGAVGSSLGGAISKWLGAGDYTIAKNTIVQRASANIPMMHNTGQSVMVRHREFVGTISGSTNFTVQKTMNLNPGVASSFPWLCNIATRFQEYEFKGLVFHYVPTSGTFNGSSAALGSVMIQTSYRSTDTAPSSKVEMLNEYCSNETVPFDTMVHPIECDPKENPFSVHYIRTGAITSGEPLMYDLGTTFVCTQGMASTDVVGDLWVTYEVELKKPLISSPVVSSPAFYGRSYNNPSTTLFFSGSTPFPQQGSLEVTATGKTITLPARAGAYFICVEIFSPGGLTHATAVQWTGSITSTNITSFPYNGSNTTQDTVCTGTNPTINALRWTLGVYLVDSTQVGTVTLPNAQWSSGSTSNLSLVVFSTGS